MALKIIETADGSNSFYHRALDETYHSTHGAVQESMHVFIKTGLLPLLEKKRVICILEMGFGTGLNAWLSAVNARQSAILIKYFAVEAFPVPVQKAMELNYPEWGKNKFEKELFAKIHRSTWEKVEEIDDYFELKKTKQDFRKFIPTEKFDLIYFDAFGPQVQPELWTEKMFEKLFMGLNPGGILVTYSVKGSVRRAMKKVGFTVEKIPGPPGKREICRAVKG